MNKIVEKIIFSDVVTAFVVEAPDIARSCKAGNFVIVRSSKKGERIPLTIADSDNENGTIMLVVQNIGNSTKKICSLEKGEEFTDIVGPLGKSTHIDNFGTVLCAGGGVGAAPLLPIAKALKKAGNRIVVILAARTKELIILEKEFREFADKVVIYTDNGSYGNKGLVTDGIEEIIKSEKIDRVEAIGPAIMMKFVSLLTKKHKIPTEVSLNTVMVDGTGMCGACRVSIDGETKFVCIDGPEFDAHKVDFDEMIMRLSFKQNR